jgi:predicted transposase YdaD
LPYVFEKYRVKYKQEGLEEGMAKGMEEGRIKGLDEGMQVLLQKYIKNNPGLSDEAIAHLFEVEVALVHRARHLV